MYLKEEQVEQYLGTGAKNAQGQDLPTFLNDYDPQKYQNPCNTVDTVIFTFRPGNPIVIDKVLLIQRGNHPSIGWWALPGGFVEYREDMDEAALRELKEETGIDHIEVEQFKSYGAYDRDPRTRIITTAYVSLIPSGSMSAQAGDDAQDAGWFDMESVCTERVEDEKGVTHALYHLKLTEKERNIVAEADVEITRKEGAILENERYRVVRTNLIASDHAAIILEGYHHVLKKIKKAAR